MEIVIERSLVHKESPAATLLASATRKAQGHWVFDIKLPGGMGPSPKLGYSTILAAEMIRQAAIAFAHLDCDVPMDSAFLLHELSFVWCKEAFELDAETAVDAQLDVHIHASRMRRNQLSDLQLTGSLFSGDVVVGIAHGDLSCISPQTYKAIRRNAPAVEETNTGELGIDLENVEVRDRELEANVVWNWGDEFIFDHFSDHVPGLLLGRAALSAHEILTGEAASAITLQCGRFGEFNAAVDLAARLQPNGETAIEVTQGADNLAVAHCFRDEFAMPGTTEIQFQRNLPSS